MSRKERSNSSMRTPSKKNRIFGIHPYEQRGQEIGQENLVSGLNLLEEMVEQGLILGTKAPSKKQKSQGIDSFCLVQRGGQTERVPVRIVSSLIGQQEARAKFGWESLIVFPYRKNYVMFVQSVLGQLNTYFNEHDRK